MRRLVVAGAVALAACAHEAVRPPAAEAAAAPPPSAAAAPANGKPRVVPPYMLYQLVVERHDPHLPLPVRMKNAGKQVVGVYFITVGTDGSVTDVVPAVGIPGADAAIMDALRTWRFKPQPLPIRSQLRFAFDVPIAP